MSVVRRLFKFLTRTVYNPDKVRFAVALEWWSFHFRTPPFQGYGHFHWSAWLRLLKYRLRCSYVRTNRIARTKTFSKPRLRSFTVWNGPQSNRCRNLRKHVMSPYGTLNLRNLNLWCEVWSKAYSIEDIFVPSVRVSPPKEKRCKRATSPGPQWGHDFTLYRRPLRRVFIVSPCTVQVQYRYGTVLFCSCRIHHVVIPVTTGGGIIRMFILS